MGRIPTAPLPPGPGWQLSRTPPVEWNGPRVVHLPQRLASSPSSSNPSSPAGPTRSPCHRAPPALASRYGEKRELACRRRRSLKLAVSGGGSKGRHGAAAQKPHGTHKTHKFAPGVSWWAGGGRARYDRHNFLSFCFLATLRDPPGRSVGPHLRLVARSATQKDCWVLATVSKFSAQLFYRCYTRRCYLAGNEIQLKKAVKERRGC